MKTLSRTTLFLAALCLLWVPPTLNAQVDPRGKIRTLRTAHFRVHYPVALDSMARRSAIIAEDAWDKLAKTLVTPAVPVELLLQDNIDLSNGFAQPFPTNRITIYATPPVDAAELRYHDDWLRLVISHELTHIFHLDRAGGIFRVGRHVFGRDVMFFPNVFLPSWILEGLAVHYESELTGSGRIVSSALGNVASADAHDNAIRGPDAWSPTTTRYPRGQTVYAYGSLLMHREAVLGGDSSMRKFIDQTATFPIPFFLNRAAKKAFGKSFYGAFAGLRDSLKAAVAAESGKDDSLWQRVSRGTELGAYSAAHPRWRSNDTLQWVASNGRDVTGLFVSAVPGPHTPEDKLSAPQRLARRNSPDVNAVGPKGTTVFSQYDFADLYTIRSDLYLRDAKGEHRLTHNARLIQPDVRAKDGAIVAVQLLPGGSQLVRVNNGVVTPLTHDRTTKWADPRWDPTFNTIAAVQLLPSGIERVVLLDTLGYITRIVAETRGVMATPVFVPTSVELMWSSDRSGRMQLEIADISQAFSRNDISNFDNGVARLRTEAFVDTLWRANVRAASNVSTSISDPDVSPDGLNVAALIYHTNGYTLAVAPLERDGPPIKDSWYVGKEPAPNNDSVLAAPSTPYRPLRQLLPHSWEPVIGQARDGGSSFGATTSGEDILQRHFYYATADINPRNGETDGAVAYQYAGLGMPVVTLSASQNWDGTFRILNSAGDTLGDVGRRLRYVSAELWWSVPRVRWSASYSIGAQYELRDFTSETDSALGAPGSVLRTGTRYPSLFVKGGFGNLARGARGFSVEQGVAASANLSVRKREGLANSESWRTVGVIRAFQPLPFPGYARHVIAARLAGGITDIHSPAEFNVGGVSGSEENVGGVSLGDPSRTFPVRGFAPSSQRGLRAVAGTVEYRAPLSILARGLGLLPFYVDKFSLSTFADAARAWCPANAAQRVTALCEAPGKRDGWLASAGAELNIDLAMIYNLPVRARLGLAKPLAAPPELSRKAAIYFTLGTSF